MLLRKRGRRSKLRALQLLLFGELWPLTWFNICVGVRAFYPLVVLYCTQAGMSLSQVGVLFAATTLTHVLVDVPLSLVADKFFGYHQMLRLGGGLVAAAYAILLAWSGRPSFYLVLGCMVLQGMGNGLIWGTKDAYSRDRIEHTSPSSGAMKFERYDAFKGMTTWILQAVILSVLLLLLLSLGRPELAPRIGCGMQLTAALVALVMTRWILPVPSGPRRVRTRIRGVRQRLLVAHGAVLVGISNAVAMLTPFLCQQNGGGASWTLLAMVGFWLSAAVSAALTMVYEYRLGPAKAMLGLVICGGSALLVMGVAPGRWFLVGVMLGGVLTGCYLPMLIVRITHSATLPATAISTMITGGVLIVAIADVVAGWTSEHDSASAAARLILVALVPTACLLGWMSKDAPRGWDDPKSGKTT